MMITHTAGKEVKMLTVITDEKVRRREINRMLRGTIDGETGKRFTINTKYRCIHCNRTFFGFELTVTKSEQEEPPFWVLCKHYPECDGSVIDLFLDEDD